MKGCCYSFRTVRRRKSVTAFRFLHLSALEDYNMAKYALYVSLKAKPGKERDVEAFLKQGAEMSKKEAGTVSWFGLKEDEGSYSVFDTFNDEAARDAHLNGEIAKALMAKASELFANPPQIHKINIVADK
jgi:quinol monooxygenase YgiN